MSVTFNFSEEHMILSDDIPVQARNYVQQAINNYDNTEVAESHLLNALQLAPHELEIYISVYKFYFYKKFLNSAEQFADLTLITAAKQGGINSDWNLLNENSCDWKNPSNAQRVYLYSMKALGFIYLRTNRLEDAEKILSKLLLLDMHDLVGGSVVMSLAEKLSEDNDVIN